ncbi:MAG TPA: hypothetical protein VHG08_09310 [Longimicrobium sp.]|nr:hypothetical protein [Longimicrobium sp.]
MKKLKLQAEALEVESFPTGKEQGGTAQSVELFATRPQACDPFSLPPRCS